MRDVNQVMGRMGLTDNYPTSSTPERTSEQDISDEAKDKTILVFNKLRTCYGRSKLKVLFSSDDQLKQMRREWADEIDKLTVDQIKDAFRRLKGKLASEDERYEWPNVGRILALAHAADSKPAAHRVVARRLPEPEWRKREKRTLGRLAAQTSIAVLDGRACFLEDKWHASC